MSAVTGSIVSSKDISLSRAARTLRQFVESDTAAKPDTAAYLRRALAAFDELLEFHDEIERGEGENAENDYVEEDITEKKKKKKRDKERKEENSVGLDAEQDSGAAREVGDGDIESEKKRKKKKKRKRENGEERSDIDLSRDKNEGLDEVEKEVNLLRETENLGNTNSEVNSARKKKKRKKSDKERETEEN